MTKKTVENIKSIILVVLFLITILLLYLQFGGKGEVKISSLIPDFSQTSEELEVSDFLLPSEIMYNSGDGSYRDVSRIKDNFRKYNNMFVKLCDETSVMVTEISKEQFQAAVKDYESVKISFSYSILFSNYCNLYSISRTSGFSGIERISAFAFSAAAPDSVLLEDLAAGKYYRLIPDVAYDMGDKIKPEGVLGESIYYEAESILGQGGDNLFPLLSESGLSPENYELEKEDGNYRTELAQAVFGETFNFVRRIADSFGNYTYMYGYGQKTLTILADGSMEYKEEASSGSSNGLFEDLKTALVFAEKLDCFDSLDDSDYVVSDIIETGSGRSASYTFIFRQLLGGVEVRTENKIPLEIKVENGKVVNLKKNAMGIKISAVSPEKPVVDAANAIASSAKNTEEFAYLAENYRSIRPVIYIRDGELLTCWMLVLNDGSIIYYDLYQGVRVD